MGLTLNDTLINGEVRGSYGVATNRGAYGRMVRPIDHAVANFSITGTEDGNTNTADFLGAFSNWSEEVAYTHTREVNGKAADTFEAADGVIDRYTFTWREDEGITETLQIRIGDLMRNDEQIVKRSEPLVSPIEN